MKAWVQRPLKDLQRGPPCDLDRRPSSLGQRLYKPTRRQSINVPIPDLPAIAKNQIAEGLDFQAMAVSQTDQPGGQQFIRKRSHGTTVHLSF
jgi:hypothetical protein